MKTKLANRTEILSSAVSLARLLVTGRPPEARENHLKELLQVLVWKVTEADGKYNTRYVSEGYKNNPDQKTCEHEHVIERKKIVTKMLANPAEIEELLTSAVACLVLEEEHKRLTKLAHTNPELEGWERYKHAGVRVYDTIEQRFLW